MLLALEIEQLALIDHLTLTFRPGLNVLTGETGAGKSIILDALSVAMGGRASTELIRAGADRAVVIAAFDLTGQGDVLQGLTAMGVRTGDDNTLVGRREVAAGGRGRVMLNGSPANVSMLRQAVEPLVDLHGQHEFQTLLHPDRHLDLLDQYGGSLLRSQGKALELLDRFAGMNLMVQRRQLSALWQQLSEMDRTLTELSAAARDRARREDLLHFQVQELTAARLQAGEEEALFAERQRLAHGERLLAAVQETYELLYEGRSRQLSASDLLGQCQTTMAEAAGRDANLAPVLEMVAIAMANVEEAARFLSGYRDRVDISPARLAQVEARLELLAGLRRKYGDTVPEMLAYLTEIQAELERLATAEERKARLLQRQAELGQQAEGLATTLSAARKAAAAQLGQRVSREVADLGMPDAEFAVVITGPEAPTWQQLGPRGWDSAEFHFRANPGEPVKALARVASGGELSRIMLALKAILARVDGVGTLVFDEIDTGISGRAAQAVAEKLARIARDRQVLCVTHLPQVAAMADTHVSVRKHVAGGRTVSAVLELNAEERAEEIARMIGGAEVTDLTLANAREMLVAASRYKRSTGRA